MVAHSTYKTKCTGCPTKKRVWISACDTGKNRSVTLLFLIQYDSPIGFPPFAHKKNHPDVFKCCKNNEDTFIQLFLFCIDIPCDSGSNLHFFFCQMDKKTWSFNFVSRNYLILSCFSVSSTSPYQLFYGAHGMVFLLWERIFMSRSFSRWDKV